MQKHGAVLALVALAFGFVMLSSPLSVWSEDPTPTPTETATPTPTWTPYPGLAAVGTEVYQRWPMAAVPFVETAVAMLFPSDTITSGVWITFPVSEVLGGEAGASTYGCGGCWAYDGGLWTLSPVTGPTIAPTPAGLYCESLVAYLATPVSEDGYFRTTFLVSPGDVSYKVRNFYSRVGEEAWVANYPTIVVPTGAAAAVTVQVTRYYNEPSSSDFDGLGVRLIETPAASTLAKIVAVDYKRLVGDAWTPVAVTPAQPSNGAPAPTAATAYGVFPDVGFEFKVPESLQDTLRLFSRIGAVVIFVLFLISKIRSIVKAGD